MMRYLLALCLLSIVCVQAMDVDKKKLNVMKQKALSDVRDGKRDALLNIDELVKHKGTDVATLLLERALENPSEYTRDYLHRLLALDASPHGKLHTDFLKNIQRRTPTERAIKAGNVTGIEVLIEWGVPPLGKNAFVIKKSKILYETAEETIETVKKMIEIKKKDAAIEQFSATESQLNAIQLLLENYFENNLNQMKQKAFNDLYDDKEDALANLDYIVKYKGIDVATLLMEQVLESNSEYTHQQLTKLFSLGSRRVGSVD